MKNILIPVDFSVHAQSALEAAVEIAKRTNGSIHLLNIIDIPVGWQNLSVEEQQQHPALESKLTEAKLKLQKFSEHPILEHCDVHTHIEGGVPFEQINLFAKRIKSDLLVMGVHGAGEKDSKFIGSTAQRVIRTAPCPVLNVKHGFHFDGIDKILFASDFDENVGPAIQKTLGLATQLKADVDFGYIRLAGDTLNKENIESRVGKFTAAPSGIKLSTVVHYGHNKESGIIQCAQERGAKIIAMVTHLRKQKPGYLLGITDDVLYHSNLPVLSFVLDEYRHQNE